MIYTKVSSTDLADLAIAIKYEQDGKAMMRQIRQELRTAAKPAEVAAKASIMSMPSSGMRNQGGSLRAAIAKQIKTKTSLGKNSAGVTIKVKRMSIRKFNAPAYKINKGTGWRHPVRPWRREGKKVVTLPRAEWTWVQQKPPKPEWFDNAVEGRRASYEAACLKAMNDAADRIAHKT